MIANSSCVLLAHVACAVQAASLEQQLHAVSDERSKLEWRRGELVAELESARLSAEHEQGRMAGELSALRHQLEDARSAAAKVG
jgi:predicted  nucleic acid-binding Zn-ribbon protein